MKVVGFGPTLLLYTMGPSSNGKAAARLAAYGEFDSPRTYQSIVYHRAVNPSSRGRESRSETYIHCQSIDVFSGCTLRLEA